jgi:hypothetical protein
VKVLDRVIATFYPGPVRAEGRPVWSLRRGERSVYLDEMGAESGVLYRCFLLPSHELVH